jgi:DNA-binding CsgD family transcriptional regulator
MRRVDEGPPPVGGLDLPAARDAAWRLSRAADFATAQAGLKDLAVAIGMPLLAWSPDVSRPDFDADMDAFFRAQGWPDAVMALWWDRNVMLKNPLYIRCRLRSAPFVTGALDKAPAGLPEVRKITGAMRDMGVRSLITTPVRLPRGQIAMITWCGPLSGAEAERVLAEARTELLAAGYHFMHAYEAASGRLPSREEDLSRLTPREWECLRMTAQGCREEEAARMLGLASTTVRYHLDNVVRKLGASNRTHAVALAAQLGLLGPIG